MNVKVRDGVAIVALGDTLLELWQSPATADRWQWNFAEFEQMARRHAGGVLLLALILPSSRPPNAALRGQMRDDLRRIGPKLRKLVVVPLGDGFWLSVVRTIVRGTLLVTGHSKQQAVVATLEQALDRIQQAALPGTPSRAQLRSAVDALYRGLDLRQTNAA